MELNPYALALAIGCAVYLIWYFVNQSIGEEDEESIRQYEEEIKLQRWREGDPNWRDNNEEE